LTGTIYLQTLPIARVQSDDTVSYKISAAFMPLAIRHPIQFSVAFNVILSTADPTLLILEQPKQFSYKFINFKI